MVTIDDVVKTITTHDICGGENCLFYEECVADKAGDSCKPFVIRTLKKLLEEEA